MNFQELIKSKLIILSALLLTSCASSNYKRRDTYQVRYTVERLYKCPEGYALSVNSMECVKVGVLSVKKENALVSIKKPRKAVKKASRPLKIDCKRVFQEINKCSM